MSSRDRRLLQEIAKNTRPVPTSKSEQSVSTDMAGPQNVFVYGPVNAGVDFAGAVQTYGIPLRPPQGTYYRLKCLVLCVATSGASANMQVGFGICSDNDAATNAGWGLPYRHEWFWASPVIAASHDVSVQAAPGLDYTFYEIGAGDDIYYTSLPEILISYEYPLRLYAVNVNNDYVSARVVYEVIRT